LPALSNNWLNRFNSLRLYNQNVQGESISIPGLEPGEYTVVATASENRDWRYDGDYLANLRIASAFVTIQSEGEEVGVTLVFSDSR
jgi:hypothetical protein